MPTYEFALAWAVRGELRRRLDVSTAKLASWENTGMLIVGSGNRAALSASPDASYDVILCHDVVGRVGTAETTELLRHMARLLRLGGEARVYGTGEAAGDSFLAFAKEIGAYGDLAFDLRPIFVDDTNGTDFGVLLVLEKVSATNTERKLEKGNKDDVEKKDTVVSRDCGPGGWSADGGTTGAGSAAGWRMERGQSHHRG